MKINTIIFFILIATCSVFGQTEKPLKEKLEKVTGKVEKITVKTDKGSFIFEGAEAEKLLKRMQQVSHKVKVKLFSDDAENLSVGKGTKIIVFNDEDADIDSDNINVWVEKLEDDDEHKKDVDVEVKNGKKFLTVTTNENGKKKIKVYTGKDADKYLKENKDKDVHHLKLDKIKKGQKLIWVEKEEDSEDNDVGEKIEKKIKVEDKNGVKTITVTTTENGKSRVKTYSGKDAEEFLDKMEKDMDFNIKFKGNNRAGKNIEKIIIMEKEKKDKD